MTPSPVGSWWERGCVFFTTVCNLRSPCFLLGGLVVAIRDLSVGTISLVLLLLPMLASAQASPEKNTRVPVLIWGVENPAGPESSELVISAVGPPPAHADGINGETILSLRFFTPDGKELGDPAFPVSQTLPEGGVVYWRIYPECVVGSDCSISVDDGRGGLPQPLPGRFVPLHDRVIVRAAVACDGRCSRRFSVLQTVVDADGGTLSSASFSESLSAGHGF